MSLKFGFKTDVGLKRRSNQDSGVIVRGEALNGELDALLVIADGMGGRLGGEVAAEIVVRTVPESVAINLGARNGAKTKIDARRLLAGAIAESHARVQERQAQDAELSGMGTTCVAAILDANLLTVANVGDSRAYLVREGSIRQLTQDHSSVWEQVVAGNMTPEEARTSRFRNQITRSIGSEVSAVPDIETFELQQGDTLLFCSDGLYSELCDDELARLLSSGSDPQQVCDRLVDAALRAGGRDNVTVIALRYGDFRPVTVETKRRVDVEPADDPLNGWRAAGFETGDRQNDRESHSLRSYRGAGRRSASLFLLGLVFVLAVVAAAEFFTLVRFSREFTRLRQTPPEVVVRTPDRATDHDLRYGGAVEVSRKPVRDIPLAVDSDGNILAASTDGSLIHIDSRGQVTPLPNQERVAGMAVAPSRESMLLATDLSGNRYQLSPGARAISKFDPDGILKSAEIGQGTLFAPTCLWVDPAGNIFVIDQHHVMKITASVAPKSPSEARIGR